MGAVTAEKGVQPACARVLMGWPEGWGKTAPELSDVGSQPPPGPTPFLTLCHHAITLWKAPHCTTIGEI